MIQSAELKGVNSMKFKKLFYINCALLACSAFAESVDYSKFRRQPLLNVAAEKTIHVKDFGAIPNDGKNDYIAIRKAMTAVMQNGGNTKVVFDKGVYDIEQTPEDIKKVKALITLSGINNVEVDGQGAEIIMRTPNIGFVSLSSCEKNIFKNFVVDYDPTPWIEGTITELFPSEKAFNVEIRESSPLPEAPIFDATDFGCLLDPKVPGRIKYDSANHFRFSKIEKISGRIYKFFVNYPVKEGGAFAVGDRFIYLSRNRSASLCGVSQTKDVTFQNITSYASGGGHYVGAWNEALNVLNCKALIKKDRWKGGNADFVHMQNGRVGPWVEGCRIEGISDDTMVIYSRPMLIKEVLDGGKRLKLRKASDFEGKQSMKISQLDVFVGEKLAFLDTDTGEYRDIVEVESIDTDADRTITLKTPAKNIEAMSAGAVPLQVYNLDMTRNFVIKDNQFRDSRRYGIYWKGSYGIIENNDFEGLSHEAISIHNEARAPNGPTCVDVMIVGNKIRDCGFEKGYLNKYSSAAISIHCDNTKYNMTESVKSHKNILIKNNVVENWCERAIFARNVEGLTLINNKVGNPRPNVPAQDNPICIELCSKVKQ